MVARVLLRRRAAVVAPAMAASLALFPSVALAEAPSVDESARAFARKPIYDDEFEAPLPKTSAEITPIPSTASATIPPEEKPEPSTTPAAAVTQRGPTPTDRLAVQIGKARMFLHRQAMTAEDAVNDGMHRAFNLEKSFTSTVASLAPSRESGEKLMPGLVYVLVASMAGSVLTRNRNVLLRASAPLALGVGAGWFLIPVTMTNVSDLLWQYEKRVPAVANAHISTRQSIQQAWQTARVHVDSSKNYVDEKVVVARDTMEGWVKSGK